MNDAAKPTTGLSSSRARMDKDASDSSRAAMRTLFAAAPDAIAVLNKNLSAPDPKVQVEAARAVLEHVASPMAAWFDLYGTLHNRSEYTLLMTGWGCDGSFDPPDASIAPGGSSKTWDAWDSWCNTLSGWVRYKVEGHDDWWVEITFSMQNVGSNSYACTTNVPGYIGWCSYCGGWKGSEEYYFGLPQK